MRKKSQSGPGSYSDVLISDFSDPSFQCAFRNYFPELGISVNDWDRLFKKMNDQGDNNALIGSTERGDIVGFIQFKQIVFTSWFFQETYGFILEFWVAEQYRNKKLGAGLLKPVEEYFCAREVYSVILTTDTAEHFCLSHGYVKAPACKAKNEDDVHVKRLRWAMSRPAYTK